MTFKFSSEKFWWRTPVMVLVGKWQPGRSQVDSMNWLKDRNFFMWLFQCAA